MCTSPLTSSATNPHPTLTQLPFPCTLPPVLHSSDNMQHLTLIFDIGTSGICRMSCLQYLGRVAGYNKVFVTNIGVHLTQLLTNIFVGSYNSYI